MMWGSRFFDRLLRPRYVKLIVPVSMLRAASKVDGGKISETCGELVRIAESTRSFFMPKYVVDFQESEDGSEGPDKRGANPGTDEQQTESENSATVGLLPRHKWTIMGTGAGSSHVAVGAHADRGYRVYTRVAASDLPKFLSRLEAEDEALFGPWPARLTTVKDHSLPARNPTSPLES